MKPTIDWTKIKASPNVPQVDPRTIALIQIKQALDRAARRLELKEAHLRG